MVSSVRWAVVTLSEYALDHDRRDDEEHEYCMDHESERLDDNGMCSRCEFDASQPEPGDDDCFNGPSFDGGCDE